MARKSGPQGLHRGFVEQFVEECRAFDVAPPASLIRGLELLDAADDHAADRKLSNLLSLSPDEIAPLLVDLSIRRHAGRSEMTPDGLGAGAAQFSEQLLIEMRTAVLPELEQVVADLRPVFDEAARPFVAAAREYGFTHATTSDEVIERADEGAAAAWRNLRHAEAALLPVVSFRRSISEVFDIAPTRDTLASSLQAFGQFSVNYSVCFAEGENWSLDDGYVLDQHRTHIDWLALAAGGLRLNSPAEVEEKIRARVAAQRTALPKGESAASAHARIASLERAAGLR
ncbi:hypothetical protein [Microbacterium sp. NPDC077184]|uniref:hypothetical protein n=1 Tax=Microbacterium sp. NPDC077184 TaxID=3154764 RepID=UPI003428F57B